MGECYREVGHEFFMHGFVVACEEPPSLFLLDDVVIRKVVVDSVLRGLRHVPTVREDSHGRLPLHKNGMLVSEYRTRCTVGGHVKFDACSHGTKDGSPLAWDFCFGEERHPFLVSVHSLTSVYM